MMETFLAFVGVGATFCLLFSVVGILIRAIFKTGYTMRKYAFLFCLSLAVIFFAMYLDIGGVEHLVIALISASAAWVLRYKAEDRRAVIDFLSTPPAIYRKKRDENQDDYIRELEILRERDDYNKNYKRQRPKVDERRWRGENELYDIVSAILSDYQVFREASPDWLTDRRRLDICIPKLNLAFEFHGKQHFEPVEHFGGKKAFKERQISDKLKIKMCRENGVDVITISHKEVLSENLIRQKLEDLLNDRKKKTDELMKSISEQNNDMTFPEVISLREELGADI